LFIKDLINPDKSPKGGSVVKVRSLVEPLFEIVKICGAAMMPLGSPSL